MQHLRNRRHQLVASVALLTILTAACGDIPTATPSSPTSTTTKPAPMRTTTTTTTTVDPNVRTLAMARVLIVEAAAQTAAHKSEAVVTEHSGERVRVTAVSGSNCGGTDYPPCTVAQRESGNTYGAYNPTGCGGSGCYGRWQFGGFWAGKLGLPLDLSTATPAQQDAAARQLWAHGAGCSNWAAC